MSKFVLVSVGTEIFDSFDEKGVDRFWEYLYNKSTSVDDAKKVKTKKENQSYEKIRNGS